ncbi:hypothetical protein L1987_30007 [Smallanthus sonchifolius]|uniref:Uncharacterized protein n=1 Tax=Smallanthus sonchifolius TaxID=185202 RepID=A0ACB9I3E2_9ASTR|nr:hypothetical protein L1987_30007 [Smallanthus sonchifolius]
MSISVEAQQNACFSQHGGYRGTWMTNLSIQVSVSPVLDRPKKRCRQDDPFGLDELLGLGSFEPEHRREAPEVANEKSDQEGREFDLNMKAISEGSCSQSISSGQIEVAEPIGQPLDEEVIPVDVEVVSEVIATMELGKLVGGDLQGYNCFVHESISGKDWVRNIKVSQKISFIALQETQHFDLSRVDIAVLEDSEMFRGMSSFIRA